MKTILITLLMTFASQSFAGFHEEIILKELFNADISQELVVDDETFIWNIQGYACPIPAINLNWDL